MWCKGLNVLFVFSDDTLVLCGALQSHLTYLSW